MRCHRCNAVMEPGDEFCENCGTPSSATGNGKQASAGQASAGQAAVRQIPAARQAPVPSQFFSHVAPRPDGRMTNATRYLSAAAYLDSAYAATVIRELVSSQRAVAPSVGIDLGPIIRHCLRARNIQLARDITLSILLLVGLITDYGQTILILIVCFFVGFLPSVNWARRSARFKVFTAVSSILLIGSALLILAIINLFVVLREAVSQGLGSTGQGVGAAGQAAGPGISVLFGPAVLVAIVLTQVIYTFVRSRTLCEQLGPEAPPQRPRFHGVLVEKRIAHVEAAQYGNLVLYSGANPFIGTGQRTRAWSIAVELRRGSDDHEPSARPRRPREYVAIDPVELHRVLRDRLLNLKGGDLPPNERLQALTVRDHVVGLGQRRWDSPLIDPAMSTPYSQANPEAIAALIRHPQAGVRYYQRVSVCDEGQSVWSGRQKVMDGSDQDISASAFVYVAVEGHMFYLEFVSAAMPPVNPRWHLVDTLPRVSPGRFFARVVQDAFSSIFRDLIYAPARAVRSVAEIAREGRTAQDQAAAAQEYLYGNIGARVSVRELGAAAGFVTYIQKLDAEKYTKLTERLVTDTVLDFLASKGVDTSAYVSSATTVNDNSTVFESSTFNGPMAFGAGASAQQTNQRQPERG